MVMALDLSLAQGWISTDDRRRGVELIAAAGLPIAPPQGMQAEDFRRLMAVDKKVLDGQLRLVLLRQLGEAVVTADFAPTNLDSVLAGVGQ
jgi:3-dehydroquinate synthase